MDCYTDERTENTGLRDDIEYLGLFRDSFSNWRRDKGTLHNEHIDRIEDTLGVFIDFFG